MSQVVLIPEPVAESGLAYLRTRGYTLRVGCGPLRAALATELRDCDGLLLRSAVIDRSLLAAATRLKVIARHGIGVDNIDLAAAAEYGVTVTNAPLSNAVTVAEHTLMLILALAKNLLLADRAVRTGDTGFRSRVLGLDLDGKVLGIVGLGRIGSALARKATHGLGMRVLGYDPYASTPPPLEVEGRDTLAALLRDSDVVSLHLPLTASSRHLIGRAELAYMKPSALLINAARGGLVDETALADALRAGALAGAGLDVQEEEPVTPDHPLLAFPNVILTPHHASLTHETGARMALHAAMGIHEVLSGTPPTWPVVLPVEPS